MSKDMQKAEVWSQSAKGWVPIIALETTTPEDSDAEPEVSVLFTMSVGGEDIECRKVLPLSSSSLRGLSIPGSGRQRRSSAIVAVSKSLVEDHDMGRDQVNEGHRQHESDEEEETFVVVVQVSFADLPDLCFDFKQSCARVQSIEGDSLQKLIEVGDKLLSINGMDVEGLAKIDIESIWNTAALQSAHMKTKLPFLELRLRRIGGEMPEVDPDVVRRWGKARAQRTPSFGDCSMFIQRPPSITVPRCRWAR
eukprot:TRINITY_DN107968_c0_g1_i1.p1 TRINITY_DN107968_c0_g1~~TRINITY_DN107968_c0_g1_i1.p1  ORF type:complete len:283 (+),score=50.06 TRINITY_DN107968_c0_g1_i1:98-850(+)